MASDADQRTFVTSLINAVPNLEASDGSNPLQRIPQNSRNILMTLHVLFPNEFLPALDILDRNLVSRLLIQEHEPISEQQNARDDANAQSIAVAQQPRNDINLEELTRPSADRSPSQASQNPENQEQDRQSHPKRLNPPVYIVVSAQPSRHHHAHGSTSTSRFHDPTASHYEVRPLAWNCSCPAFAFSAFPGGGGTGNSWMADPDLLSSWSYQRQWDCKAYDTEFLFGGISKEKIGPICKHLLACIMVERIGLMNGMVEEKVVSIKELAGWAAGWGG
jgi:hypothetical protein